MGNHEWTKHGRCAGVEDADDFFTQVCSLSKDPLGVLEKAKEAGKGFQDMSGALRDAGFPVWQLDQEYDQVLLSACAKSDGRWTLAAVSEMPSKCGGSSPGPSPSPPSPPSPPAPSPQAGSCQPGQKGPKCSDDDCASLHGCVRCAHSGFCTDQPLLETMLSDA